MALLSELSPFFRQILCELRGLRAAQCNSEEAAAVVATTSAGENSSIPAGFKSVAIVKTNDTGTVEITMSDASIYTLTEQGEGLSDNSVNLPAYTIATSDGGEWKWHGIQ